MVVSKKRNSVLISCHLVWQSLVECDVLTAKASSPLQAIISRSCCEWCLCGFFDFLVEYWFVIG